MVQQIMTELSGATTGKGKVAKVVVRLLKNNADNKS
jgi:hypothetical protein